MTSRKIAKIVVFLTIILTSSSSSFVSATSMFNGIGTLKQEPSKQINEMDDDQESLLFNNEIMDKEAYEQAVEYLSMTEVEHKMHLEEVDAEAQDVKYDAAVCFNSLVPIVFNYSTTPPTPVVYAQGYFFIMKMAKFNYLLFLSAIRVLTGDTFYIQYILQASPQCPYALLSFGAFNTKVK